MTDLRPEFVALQRAVAGRYSLEREIGRGGMGAVYLAGDVALSRRVAIKVLLPQLAADPNMRERFLREARTAAGLFHPNIIPIHLVEESGDLVYFVMSFVDGETIGDRVRRAGPMSAAAVTRMLQEVAWALSYAHGKGIVHRDIKPDNILLEKPRGRALVADFGIAKVTEASGGTAARELIGTAQYMSPEQASGERVDGRSDLYSLGVVGHFALTGRLPFESENVAGFLHKHITVPAPSVASRASDVPAALASAVDRCLEKSPARRFDSGEALARAIETSGRGSGELPPEVRALIRRVRVLGLVASGGSAVAFVLALLVPEVAKAVVDNGPVSVAFFLGVPLYALLELLGQLVGDARRALRVGFDYPFVRDALAAEGRTMIEEGAVQAGTVAPDRVATYLGLWSRVPARPANPVVKAGLARDAITRQWHLGLVLLGLMLLAMVLNTRIADFTIGAIGLVFAVTTFLLGPAVGKDSPLVALEWGERFLVGRFGRALFWIARRTVHREPATTRPLGERTELAIVAQVDELIAGMPRDVRVLLEDARAVVTMLQEDAQSLRNRDARVADALAQIEVRAATASQSEREQLRSELESARDRARERLKTTVAAIESIRLNLLRLKAGIGTPDDLTADIERAHEVSAAVDAELEARREVNALLKD
jgi:serine/threonine-protein kinase